MGQELKFQDVTINTVGFYLNRSLWAIIRKQHNLLKSSTLKDFSHIEFITLKVLNDLGGGSQSFLSKVMCIDKAAISRTITSLEKKGYIRREALNGSTNYVVPTEKSKSIAGEIDSITDEVNKIAFKGFSKQRMESVINNLTKIYLNVTSELNKENSQT